MSEKVYVTEQWLRAILPSPWELLARAVFMIAFLPAVSQSVLWYLQIGKSPRFSLAVAITAWTLFAVGLIAWWTMSRRRHRVLKAFPPLSKS